MKADPVGGVKCFSVGGRMVEQRQRCLGMTDEERRWRAQWLKDQVLSHDEPRFVPEYYKLTCNIFRRMYITPMNILQQILEPKIGLDKALMVRSWIRGSVIFFSGVLIFHYYLKYHGNDFSVAHPVETWFVRKPMFPTEPGYRVKEPFEYYDLGFYSSVLCQDAIPLEPPPPPEPIEEEESDICPQKEK